VAGISGVQVSCASSRRFLEDHVDAIQTIEALPDGDDFSPQEELHFQTLADSPSNFAVGEPDLQTRTYIDEYERRIHVGQPVGVYRLSDVIVSGQWGLVTDASETQLYNGLPGFGWSPQHVEHALTDVPLSEMSRDDGPPLEKATLLSFPGALTFGHWLVDIVLRLELDRMVGGSSERYIVPGPIVSWTLPILEANGVSPQQLIPIGRTEAFRVAELRVPTITGHDGVINQKLAPKTFERARRALRHHRPEAPHRQILFPIHTTQSSVNSPRNLANRDDLIAELVKSLDVHVIDPLGMTVPEQISTFANADLIIGEDSSALHNAVWGEYADLLVISPPYRNNFFHAGIQQANQNHLQMLWGEDVDQSGGFEIDIKRVSDAAQQLLDCRADISFTRRAL
jgi:hypothetical protein